MGLDKVSVRRVPDDLAFRDRAERSGVDSALGKNNRLVQPGPSPEDIALCRSVRGTCGEGLACMETSPMFLDPIHFVGGRVTCGSLPKSISIINSYHQIRVLAYSPPLEG